MFLQEIDCFQHLSVALLIFTTVSLRAMANTDARDSDVSIMFKETLEAFGYQVILATDGSEAIALFKSNAARIDVVVLDVVMPGMSGPDAYAEMSAIRPSLGIVIAPGYTAEAASLTSLVEKGASALQKPYTATSLSKAIRGALETSSSRVSD